MAASVEKIDQEQADRIGAALLAAPVAEQKAVRESIERQRERKPRGRAAMLWVAIAALIGFRS
ncbi:MAG: hypothetical protein H7Y89_02020 [Steroidobacteraceae bacterium]|nr:hypothetical protein [Steroidobacteraceae bacterium]